MRKARWTITTGYEDDTPSLRLTADGGPMSEGDCIQVAAALLNHVRTRQLHRTEAAKARRWHAESLAEEERIAKLRAAGIPA